MRIALITVALLAAVASGCRKPEPYWIAGLELPPGSKEVSRDETVGPLDSGLLNGRVVKRSFAITFDTPGDWPAVTAYFDAAMFRLGYTGDPSERDLMDKIKAKHPDWNDARVIARCEQVQSMSNGIVEAHGSGSANYDKPGSDFCVFLLDNKGSKLLDKGKHAFIQEMGRYSLTVFELR